MPNTEIIKTDSINEIEIKILIKFHNAMVILC